MAGAPIDPKDEDILPEWLFEDEEDEPDDDSGRYAGPPAPLAQSG